MTSTTDTTPAAPPGHARTAAVRWFLAGFDTGEHAASTLAGTFRDGYDAGYVDGVAAGRRQLEDELAAQHSAVWEHAKQRIGGAA